MRCGPAQTPHCFHQQGGLPLLFTIVEYLRHHSSDNGLEAERHKSQGAREVSSDMPAHGQEAGEE